MPDYQKMYALLCGSVSDVIDELQDLPQAAVARRHLQAALLQAEELYLNAPEPQAVAGTNLLLFDSSAHPTGADK